MTTFTLYHNPRCSKSRQTLALLEENGISPTVIEYLQDPPDAATIRDLLSKLGLQPRQLMRTKEAPYKELGLADASDDELIAAMTEHPILIERPIVVKAQRAVLGRPPENVMDLL